MSFDLKISNGNLSIKNGDLETVVDGKKLEQDILKICLTDAGSNPLVPWYGSFLTRNIIGSSQDFDLLNQIAKSQLQNAMENLKKLQDAQNQTYQRLSADEQFSTILNIEIFRNDINFTQIDVNISVLSKGRKTLKTSFSVNTF